MAQAAVTTNDETKTGVYNTPFMDRKWRKRTQNFTAITPGHPVHSPNLADTIAHLEDGLEVEGESVPERELAGGGAGDEPATLRRPRQAEDRTAHLVGGGANEARGDGVDGVVGGAGRREQLRIEQHVRLQRRTVDGATLPYTVLTIGKGR